MCPARIFWCTRTFPKCTTLWWKCTITTPTYLLRCRSTSSVWGCHPPGTSCSDRLPGFFCHPFLCGPPHTRRVHREDRRGQARTGSHLGPAPPALCIRAPFGVDRRTRSRERNVLGASRVTPRFWRRAWTPARTRDGPKTFRSRRLVRLTTQTGARMDRAGGAGPKQGPDHAPPRADHDVGHPTWSAHVPSQNFLVHQKPRTECSWCVTRHATFLAASLDASPDA